MKELDKMINGDASKKSMEELKAKERARIKRKRAKAKYDKAEKGDEEEVVNKGLKPWIKLINLLFASANHVCPHAHEFKLRIFDHVD